jgi:type II secretory pathway pseudopilin PulG
MAAPRTGEAGYNLVVMMILVTLLNVAVAASLPLWSTAIQRDKEEELISRGMQYVEAIRVFQTRYQRFPVRLEELLEIKPRSIRQLWKDPMTEDGKWGLIFQGQGAPLIPQPGANMAGGDPMAPDPDQGGGNDDGRDDSAFGVPRKGDEVAVGPIIGVYSKSDKTSIMTFNGKQRYDEWRFTIELLNGQQHFIGGAQGVAPTPGGIGGMPTSTRWIGRPLPPYLTQAQPQDGSLPGGNGLGGPDDSQGRPPQGRGPRRN